MAASCADRVATFEFINAPPGGPPPCAAPRANCADEPTQRPHARRGVPYSVCDSCYATTQAAKQPFEYEALAEPILRRSRSGESPWVSPGQGVLGYLCTFCEADEVEQYCRNTAPGGPVPPVDAQNGWQNTCTCYRSRIDLTNLPGRYCLTCRNRALAEICVEAAANKQYLLMLARDAVGAHDTPHDNLILQRMNQHRPIACRCGRDAVPASLKPKATQCLCCGGVQVDSDQVRKLRVTAARTARGARVLTHLAANSPVLSARNKRTHMFIRVRKNNNKR